MTATVDTALPIAAEVGEGPVWDPGARVLHWVDITRRQLHRFDPATRVNRTLALDQMIGAVVPARAGGLVLALARGFARLDEGSARPVWLARPARADHPSTHRFNDGKCDPAGRFWAGTMHASVRQPGAGCLYVLDTDLTVRTVLRGVTVSNGLAWSPDGKTMYYIDSPTRQVVAYDYDAGTGAIARPRVAVSIPAGLGAPDGMTIDADGMLWVAHWGGWAVRRWNPTTGKLLREVQVPSANVTSCAFGGPNLDQLYITTARYRLSDEELRAQPEAGSIFVCSNPGTRGIPASPFAG